MIYVPCAIAVLLISLACLDVIALSWFWIALFSALPTGICVLWGIATQVYQEELRSIKKEAVQHPFSVSSCINMYHGRYPNGRSQ